MALLLLVKVARLLFRLIRTAILSSGKGSVVGSNLEHPASRSATAKWSKIASKINYGSTL